jgi:hypothetical protein
MKVAGGYPQAYRSVAAEGVDIPGAEEVGKSRMGGARLLQGPQFQHQHTDIPFFLHLEVGVAQLVVHIGGQRFSMDLQDMRNTAIWSSITGLLQRPQKRVFKQRGCKKLYSLYSRQSSSSLFGGGR